MASFDFSGDEGLFMLVAAAASAAGGVAWYVPLFATRPAGGTRGAASTKLALALLPPLLLLLLLLVLENWSDPATVAGHGDYVLLFMLGGCAWLWWAAWLARAMGVSPRDDAIERGNRAAT